MSSQTILIDNYGYQFQKSNRLMLVQVQNPQMSQDEIKIHLYLQKDQTDKWKLENVRKLKFITILQPQQFIDDEQSQFYILVYPEVMSFLVNDQNFNQLKRSYGYKIMLQLALTFDEFEKRNIDWPLYSYNQLYFIDGIIYLSLIDYDFGTQYIQQKPKEIFYNFLQKYFLNDFPDIQKYMFKYDEKFEILDYLLEKNGNLHKFSLMNPPYETTLQFLLGVNQLKSIYECGNSVVKSFTTPKKLDIVQYQLPDEVVYKSTKFQKAEYDQFIMQNINREIELMELFTDSQQMAVCFLYLRIKQYSFLLQRKFAGTLADFKKTIEQAKDDQLIKIVECIGYKFALALKNMHSEKVIHRDLKPENLFIDNEDLLNSNVYIADFDRSKQLTEEKNMVLTTLANGNTAKYDPPETEQTLQYDVFQYGLIMLTVANRYQYVGVEQQGPRSLGTQYDKYYGKNAVVQHLSQYKYNPQFVDLIANCLLKESKQRPTAEQIYKQMSNIYLAKKIRIISKNTDSNQPQQQPVNVNEQVTNYSPQQPVQQQQQNESQQKPLNQKIKILSQTTTTQESTGQSQQIQQDYNSNQQPMNQIPMLRQSINNQVPVQQQYQNNTFPQRYSFDSKQFAQNNNGSNQQQQYFFQTPTNSNVNKFQSQNFNQQSPQNFNQQSPQNFNQQTPQNFYQQPPQQQIYHYPPQQFDQSNNNTPQGFQHSQSFNSSDNNSDQNSPVKNQSNPSTKIRIISKSNTGNFLTPQ